MDIGEAVHHLKEGRCVFRAGWNGKGMYLFLQPAEPEGKRLGYVVMKTVQGDLVPWLASQTDLLADDYAVADIPHWALTDHSDDDHHITVD